ncbi:PAS domain S-box protein, partial [bacterium]|nr:PAS domain S-box protein [bacterium]MBU1984545.1 PAS domain S-box protein [bacterium]
MNPEIPNHRRESRVILTLGTAIGLSLLALGIAVFATIRSYLDLRLVHEQRQQGERMMDMVLQADYLRIEALSRAAADGDTEQGEAYEEAFDLLSEALVGSSFVWDLPLHSGMHEIWMAASDLRVTEEEILDRVAAGSLREARWLLMDSAYLKERAEFREALRNTHYSFTSFVQQKSERARARLRVIWQSSAAGLLVLAGAWVILFRLLARHLRARQRAEFALSESEEKYRSLIEALPHAVVLVQDTRIVYCNRAAAAMWGYSDAEKLVGLSGYKVVAEQDCERSIAYHEARMRGETDVPDHYVVHMTRAGGEEFPAEIYVRMVTFRGCDAAQIVAIDISERQRAEDALRESEERFRSLADTAPVLIWMVGVKRHMFYFNRGWQTFTGRSIAQLYGQGWKEDVHPEDVERCLDSYERAFEARRQYTTEYRLRRSDGSYHTVLETGVPRFTRDGSFSGYIGSCVDISDRLDAELALRESERALSTLISNIPGMVYRCRNDRDWTMTFASEDGCRNLTGYAPADILENRRLSYNDLIHPDDRERIWNEVQEALSKRQTFHLEYRIHTAGGSQKWVAEQGQGVFGPDGSVLFVEGLISDATESKLAAEAQTRLLDFERIVLSVSNHFINLPLENTDEGIQDALQIVGEAASVDRAYVFLLRDQGRIADNTHEWCAEGISSEIENLQNIDPDHDLPFFARLIRNREVIQISQVNDLPEEAAAERAEMERESIQSLVIVPMVAGGHILGFVGFDSVRCQRDWSEDEIAILRILADVIASVVDRRSTAEARGVSEARFKSILKAAPTGIGVLVDRVFVEVNEAFC